MNSNTEFIDLSDQDNTDNPKIVESKKSCGFCIHQEVCILYINVAKMIGQLAQGTEVLNENVVELSPQLANYCKKFEGVVNL